MTPTQKIVVLLPHTAVGEAVRRAAKAKLYHKEGYKVYVSTESQLRSNPEAFEFLFTKNPYVSGLRRPEEGDIIDGIVTKENPFRRVVFNPEILKSWKIPREHRAVKLFYEPQIISELKDRTLLDLNISSYRLKGGRDNFDNVADYVRRHYQGALTILRKSYDLKVRGFEPLPVANEFESITYETIYDYCDIVSSCKKVACLQTGSQLVACAYNQNIECLRTEEFISNPSHPNQLLYFDCKAKDIDLR